MDGWIKLASSAILGAAGAIIAVTTWVDTQNFQVNAHEMAIQKLQATDTQMYEQLRHINERLSRIEGKLDVILHGRR